MPHELLFKKGINLQVFLSKLSASRKNTREQKTHRNFYGGDHWDDQYGYIGPLPSASDSIKSEIVANIRRMFGKGFRNVYKECVDRAVDGLLSRTPSWKISLAPSSSSKIESNSQKVLSDKLTKLSKALDSPDALSSTSYFSGNETDNEVEMKEIENALSILWTKLKIHSLLKELMRGRLVDGKSVVRIYIPRRFSKLESLTASDLIEATKYVRLEVVNYENGIVLDDDGDKLSIFEIEKEDLSSVTNKKIKFVEISFTDEEDRTFIVTVDQVENFELSRPVELLPTFAQDSELLQKANQVSSPLDLDGEVLGYQIEGERYITNQFLQSNRALNLCLTLGSSSLVESGFNEMAILNAEIETEEVSDPSSPTGKKTIAKSLRRGGGVVQAFTGVSSIDENGKQTYQTPQVIYKDPAPMTTFADGKSMYYAACLEEAKQLFALASSETNISAESRIQSRQDFLQAIMTYKSDLDELGSWLMTTLLKLMSNVCNKVDQFSEYRVVFDSKISVGKLSPEEITAVVSMYSASVVSKETTMVLLGIDDPELEKLMISVESKETAIEGLIKQKASIAINPPQSASSKNSNSNSNSSGSN